MSERIKSFQLDLDGKIIEIVVSRATTRMGIRRSLMIYAAMDAHDKAGKAGTEEDEVAYVLSYRTLPDLVAGTVTVTTLPDGPAVEGTELVNAINYPLKVEELLDLPEEFVSQWLAAIYELNPQWDPANLVSKELQGKKTNT